MNLVMPIIHCIKSFIQPHSTSENDARKEYVLNCLLLAFTILNILIFVFSLILIAYAKLPIYTIGFTISIIILFIISAILSKKKNWKYSVAIVIFTLLVSSIVSQYFYGRYSAALFYLLLIMITSILLTLKYSVLLTIFCSMIFHTINYLQQNNSIIVDPESQTMVVGHTFFLFFAMLGILIIQTLFTNQLSKSMDKIKKQKLIVIKQGEELRKHKNNLEDIVTERTRELETTHKKLVESAHKAGMTDIVSGALHTIGNILNSAKISSQVINEKIDSKTLQCFNNAKELFNQHKTNNEWFTLKNTQCKKLITYLILLHSEIVAEREEIKTHSTRVMSKIEEISAVLAQQREYTHRSKFVEQCNIIDIIEQVITLCRNTLDRFKITVERNFTDSQPIEIQKTKLLYVLQNIINNAIEALVSIAEKNRKLTFTYYIQHTSVCIELHDTGIGIAPDHQIAIFNHGFTTKENYNGYGLHSSANFMTEMKGTISVESEGINKGTRVILKLPM